MHLMIPYASALDPACLQQLAARPLPALDAALRALAPSHEEGGDEYSPLLPHELSLARLRGLTPTPDAALPTAAWALQAAGHEPGRAAWAQLTPLHCEVGSDQVTALDPAHLQLSDAESEAFFEALAWLFPADEGWQRQHAGAGRWFVAHDSLDGLPCASLDRVINRHVDTWMPEPRRLRTLQNELQMVLHGHALNTAREGRGLLSLNSVWIAGCGRMQGRLLPADVCVDTRLREAWLTGDWAAWATAWQQLDAEVIAPLLPDLKAGRATLSLAGERLSRQYRPAPLGLLAQLKHRLNPPRGVAAAHLESL